MASRVAVVVVAGMLASCAVEVEDERGPAVEALINSPRGELNEWVVMAHGVAQGCNASAITPHWLITSAHCIDENQTWATILRGDLVSDAHYDGPARVVKHPDYWGDFMVNGTTVVPYSEDDLALIQLEGDGVVFGEYARIGRPDDLALEERVVIESHGLGSDPGTSPGCDDATIGIKRVMDYALKTIEAEILEVDHGDHEICPGDSGAPSMIDLDGRWSVLSLESTSRPVNDHQSTRLHYKIGWLSTGTNASGNTIHCPVFFGGSRDFAECFEAEQAARALSAGAEHACAVLEDRTIRCWGRGRERQLGNFDDVDHALPVIGPVGDAIEVAAGDRHTCALLADSTVFCWGAGSNGQRGDGTNNNGVVGGPVRTEYGTDLTGVVSLAAGGYHTCAATSDGAAYCWGYGAFGQLGNGAAATSNVARRVGRWQTIGMGFALKAGAGGGDFQQFVPLAGVARVAAGAYHSCAIMTDGTARCWGYNGFGQLGDGTTAMRTSPQTVVGLSNVFAIDASMTTTCASRPGAEPRGACWGYNGWGQLGDGTFNSSLTPRYLNLGMTGQIDVAVGAQHACFSSDGEDRSRCAGNNASGQFGTYTPGSSTTLVSSYAANVRRSAAGDAFTCWRTDQGYVSCAGRNAAGQLGQPSLADWTLPVAVQSLNVPSWTLP